MIRNIYTNLTRGISASSKIPVVPVGSTPTPARSTGSTGKSNRKRKKGKSISREAKMNMGRKPGFRIYLKFPQLSYQEALRILNFNQRLEVLGKVQLKLLTPSLCTELPELTY